MVRFTSRKFLLTVATVAFAVLGFLIGQFDLEQAAVIAQTAVIAYLVAEGAVDFAQRLASGFRS